MAESYEGMGSEYYYRENKELYILILIFKGKLEIIVMINKKTGTEIKMKKLKKRLERKICDILSAVTLYCDGKGCFKVSSIYTFPLPSEYYVEIEKDKLFNYGICLKKDRMTLFKTNLKYDVFRKDVPFQKAYTTYGTIVYHPNNSIPGLLSLLKDLKKVVKNETN